MSTESSSTVASRANTAAYRRGWIDFENEWTSDDARWSCLAALLQRGKRVGDHIVYSDGSRIEIDAYGMFAV